MDLQRGAVVSRYLIDGYGQTLEVETDGPPDLDTVFTARCLDTGETLRIKGWLVDNIEELP